MLVELRKAWRDGTTHLPFAPAEFLEKLAVLTPRPEVQLLLYHVVLAPHARWRPQVVGFGRSAASEEVAARRAERGASRCPLPPPPSSNPSQSRGGTLPLQDAS